MPTYNYICEKCGHAFEQFQAITAKPLTQCPSCSKRSLKRLIGSGSGVIFKGSGFYQTDYRTDSYKSGQKSEKSTSDTVKEKIKPTTEDKKTPLPAKDKKKSA